MRLHLTHECCPKHSAPSLWQHAHLTPYRAGLLCSPACEYAGISRLPEVHGSLTRQAHAACREHTPGQASNPWRHSYTSDSQLTGIRRGLWLLTRWSTRILLARLAPRPFLFTQSPQQQACNKTATVGHLSDINGGAVHGQPALAHLVQTSSTAVSDGHAAPGFLSVAHFRLQDA